MCTRSERAGVMDRRTHRVVADGFDEIVKEAIEFRCSVEIHRLGKVILRPVITHLIPLAVTPSASVSRIVAKNEADGRNMNAEERILVRAGQKFALRLSIGADFNLHRGGNAACGFSESRIRQRLRGQDSQRKERAQLIEVDVGGKLCGGYGGVCHEPVRSEQTFLLTGESREQNAAFGYGQLMGLDVFCHLYQQCDVSRVVKGAVVEIVPVDRRAEAVAVEVRGDDDELRGQFRIGAGELGEDIGRTDVALPLLQLNPKVCGYVEARKGCFAPPNLRIASASCPEPVNRVANAAPLMRMMASGLTAGGIAGDRSTTVRAYANGQRGGSMVK